MKKIDYKATQYPSDLTDAQWEKIAGYFPMGNKGEIHKRSLVEAVLTMAASAGHCRMIFQNGVP
jgi:hypothetical protein